LRDGDPRVAYVLLKNCDGVERMVRDKPCVGITQLQSQGHLSFGSHGPTSMAWLLAQDV